MKKSTVKNVIKICIYVLVMLTLMLITTNILQMEVTFALENPLTEFDGTDVTSDIFFEGSKFKRQDYPANPQGEIQVLNIVEYGFSYYVNNADSYGLYIYIYNPAGANLSVTVGDSKLQMANLYSNIDGSPISYNKYQIRYIASSEDGLFYKYKLIDRDDEIQKRVRLEDSQNGERRYDISGVEIVAYGSKAGRIKYGIAFKNDSYTVEKTIALSLTYKGYGKGYGQIGAESTLSVESAKLNTQELDVKSTFYRTNGVSSLGMNHYNQLNSVYFGTPYDYIEQYGNLYGVKAEWYEYKTKDILVTADSAMYNALYNTRGINVSNIAGDNRYQLISSTYHNLYIPQAATMSMFGKNYPFGAELRTFDWAFNMDWTKFDANTLARVHRAMIEPSTLYYVFKVKDLFNDVVSGKTLLNYIDNYNKTYNSGILEIGGKRISADLFESVVDKGRTRGYNLVEISNNGDYNYNLLSFDSAHKDDSALAKWLLIGNQKKIDTDEEHLDIEPIREVYYDDIKELSAETLEAEYFVYKGHAEEFKQYVKGCEEKGDVAHIFRFALTDYHSVPVESAYYIDGDKVQAYVSRETIFKNFDIIELTYAKSGVFTVIPVSMTPIDIAGDITPPPSLEDKSKGLKWWEILLIAIAVIVGAILIVFLLINFAPYIGKFLVWLIMAPFRAINALAKAGRKRLDERSAQKRIKTVKQKTKPKTKRKSKSTTKSRGKPKGKSQTKRRK